MGQKERIWLEVEEENWLESLKSSVDEFMVELDMLEEVKGSNELTAVQKFRWLKDMKEKYNLSRVPEGYLREILEPLLKNLVGVKMEETEDSVVFSVDTLTLEFKLGYNDKVYVKDDSKYYFNRVQSTNLPKTFIEMGEAYNEYTNGEISKNKLRERFKDAYIQERVRKEKKIKPWKMNMMAFYDVYVRRSKIKVYMPKITAAMESNRLSELEMVRIAKLNKERDEKRYRVLRESRLGELIQEVRAEGIKVETSGMIQDAFYEGE